ncbi:DegT/DnrJ/EryC1/StrS aminotransferase [Actinobacteria bacterium YIM 96077]|uniref:DegT/DnrJ/EryC1/StrS aminotransferase n=1 Tax=Phytoactinopolyspora halophila TaxID=1981511 RepID=A0A329QID1_9ACTN|nr:DegT/DnrJ/EryC1/StrS family aminotransferase [Phytoactinopolyspora halophila]AYY12426.1 DegT/DnrJ/EryC1/StrS aminotransferase [Actinobacteria bacterium YIM 96077]RAW11996.1 DegT/DnrJ/EryC1/StrS aminotransferase [Phytoactinopolyspora halophila]
MIPLIEPALDGNESHYLQECIASGYVSSVGPFVERFERQFAEAVGARHAVACSSGTAALHVALRVAGAAPGQLVAVSDFTFIASVNAISYTGADALLVDSESTTWNMDTERLHDDVVRRARDGEQIPAVIEVVHVLGHPAQLEPLLDLRDRFGITIVEDAAESLGASWSAGQLAGRQVGTAGDIGCFSFNGNKIMTSGGGGMITTDDADLAARARHLTTQAKLATGHYVHDTVGYNYRLSNLAAAVGQAQLERLDAFLDAKRAIAERYDDWLWPLPLTPAPAASWADPSYWLYSVLLDDEPVDVDHVVVALAELDVQARRLWPPIHRQAPYRSAERLGGRTAEHIYRNGLSLPSSVSITPDEQLTVVNALTKTLSDASFRR